MDPNKSNKLPDENSQGLENENDTNDILSDEEMDEIAGGMQNQLNKANFMPGGLPNIHGNPAVAIVRCNGFISRSTEK